MGLFEQNPLLAVTMILAVVIAYDALKAAAKALAGRIGVRSSAGRNRL